MTTLSPFRAVYEIPFDGGQVIFSVVSPSLEQSQQARKLMEDASAEEITKERIEGLNERMRSLILDMVVGARTADDSTKATGEQAKDAAMEAGLLNDESLGVLAHNIFFRSRCELLAPGAGMSGRNGQPRREEQPVSNGRV